MRCAKFCPCPVGPVAEHPSHPFGSQEHALLCELHITLHMEYKLHNAAAQVSPIPDPCCRSMDYCGFERHSEPVGIPRSAGSLWGHVKLMRQVGRHD